MWNKYLILFLLLEYHFIWAVNILGIISLPSKSHFGWNRQLYHALSKLGHNITVIAADTDHKNTIENITYIHADAYNVMGDDFIDVLEMTSKPASGFSSVLFTSQYYELFCNAFMMTDGFKQLLNYPNEFQFDLIIYDFTAGPCLLGFLHKFKYPPLVGVSPFSVPPYTFDITGGHKKPAYTVHYGMDYVSQEMSFFQRTYNTLVYIWESIYRKYVVLPNIDKIMRSSYNISDLPYAEDLEQKMILALVNTHYTLEVVEPMPANVIPVGGLQIVDPKPLTTELKEFIHGAKKGAVLFSLGTIIRSEFLDSNRKKTFIDVFKKFPEYNFIWKYESNLEFDLPQNVKIMPWLNQNDILADRKVKAFISHGGLLSTQEAAWYGVPVIGIPFFVDQAKNIKKSISAGTAIELSYPTLTALKLENALNEILHNPKYSENAKIRSRHFQDQPDKPIDRAIYWIEWTLRHRDDYSIIIPPSKTMSWFTSSGYDILLVFMIVLRLLVMITSNFIKRIKKGQYQRQETMHRKMK